MDSLFANRSNKQTLYAIAWQDHDFLWNCNDILMFKLVGCFPFVFVCSYILSISFYVFCCWPLLVFLLLVKRLRQNRIDNKDIACRRYEINTKCILWNVYIGGFSNLCTHTYTVWFSHGNSSSNNRAPFTCKVSYRIPYIISFTLARTSFCSTDKRYRFAQLLGLLFVFVHRIVWVCGCVYRIIKKNTSAYCTHIHHASVCVYTIDYNLMSSFT